MSSENRKAAREIVIGITAFLMLGSYFYTSWVYGRHFIIRFIFSDEFPILGLVVGILFGAAGTYFFYRDFSRTSSALSFALLLVFALLALGCPWLLALRLLGL
jgi:hypothetical protein